MLLFFVTPKPPTERDQSTSASTQSLTRDENEGVESQPRSRQLLEYKTTVFIYPIICIFSRHPFAEDDENGRNGRRRTGVGFFEALCLPSVLPVRNF